MKRTRSLCLVLAALVVVLPPPGPVVMAQSKGKPKPLVAVMPFKVERPNSDFCNDIPVDSWIKELTMSGKVRVLSCKQVDARMKAKGIIWEQEWPEPKVTAKEIGKALGVKYLLVGSIAMNASNNAAETASNTKRTQTLTMKAKLIDTSTGEVVWSDEVMETALSPNDPVAIKAAKRCVRQLAKKLGWVWATFEH